MARKNLETMNEVERQRFVAAAPDLLVACEAIIDASLWWSGEDELKHPELKKARTLAGYAIDIALGRLAFHAGNKKE